MTRTPWLVVLAAATVVLTGCLRGSDGPRDAGLDAGTDAGSDGGSCTFCTRNRDCSGLGGANDVFYCDRDQSCCVRFCIDDLDCDGLDPVLCATGGCWCDTGQCLPRPCLSHAECRASGRYCVEGACASVVLDGCRISPDLVYTVPGSFTALELEGRSGATVVLTGLEGSWSSSDPGVVAVDPAGLLAGGSTPGSASVTATVGLVTCSVSVTNFAAVAATDLRVVVLADDTRQPLSNARVVAVDSGTGAEIGSVVTDLQGEAQLSAGVAPLVDIHVFTRVDPADPAASNGRAHLSALGLSTRDIIVYLPRNPAPSRAAGIRGSYSVADFAAISDDDVHIALVGLSHPGSLVEFDLEEFVGGSVATRVVFGNLLDDDFDLPTAMVFGIGAEFFRSEYVPLGAPGTRTAWVLGGNLPLADFIQVLVPFVGGGRTGDAFNAEFWASMLPLFSGFNSGIVGAVSVPESDRIAGFDANGNPILVPDSASFPQVAVPIAVPTVLKGLVDIPRTPQLANGTYLDLVIVVAGVQAMGTGFVPLGASSGLDVEAGDTALPNGIVGDTGGDPTPGIVVVRFAPAHSGLEGSRYMTLALAMRGRGGSARLAISGLVTFFDSLGFEEPIVFQPPAFLPPAEDATWDGATRTYVPSSLPAEAFGQAVFESSSGRQWLVYHAGTTPLSSLLDPASYDCAGVACEDRAGSATRIEARMMLASVPLDDLFAFNGTDLDRLAELITAFSRAEIAP